MAERTGETPQQASGPSPMGSPLAMVETLLWHVFIQIWPLLKGEAPSLFTRVCCLQEPIQQIIIEYLSSAKHYARL